MGKLAGFGTFDGLEVERIDDKITRRLVSGEQGMVVWWDAKAGAHAAAHSHPHEQIFWLIAGKMEVRIGAERRLCGPGDVAVIPGGMEHEVWFQTDTLVIDVFSPPRQDFLAGGPPPYMRASP